MDGKAVAGGIVLVAIIILIALFASSMPASPAVQSAAPLVEEVGESIRASLFEVATTGHMYDDSQIIMLEADVATEYAAYITLPTPSDHATTKHGTAVTTLIKTCLQDFGADILLEKTGYDDGLKRTLHVCRLPDGRFGVSIDLEEVGRNVTRFVTRYKIAQDVIDYLGRNGGTTVIYNNFGGD